MVFVLWSSAATIQALSRLVERLLRHSQSQNIITNMILFCNWAAHHRSIQRNGEYWWIGCIIRSCLLGRENAIEYGTRYTNKNLLSHLFHSYIHSHARQIGCIHRYHSFDQNRFAQCDDRIVEIRKKWICAAKRSMFKRTRSHNWCGLYFWICAAVANKHSMLRTYIFFFQQFR